MSEIAELSARDLELLRLLARGLPLDAVAPRIHPSVRAVSSRLTAICGRLGCGTSILAVVCAARQGLA